MDIVKNYKEVIEISLVEVMANPYFFFSFGAIYY